MVCSMHGLLCVLSLSEEEATKLRRESQRLELDLALNSNLGVGMGSDPVPPTAPFAFG